MCEDVYMYTHPTGLCVEQLSAAGVKRIYVEIYHLHEPRVLLVSGL